MTERAARHDWLRAARVNTVIAHKCLCCKRRIIALLNNPLPFDMHEQYKKCRPHATQARTQIFFQRGEGRDLLHPFPHSRCYATVRCFFIMSHYTHPNPYHATPPQHSSFAVLRSCQLNCPLITARVACLGCSQYAKLIPLFVCWLHSLTLITSSKRKI